MKNKAKQTVTVTFKTRVVNHTTKPANKEALETLSYRMTCTNNMRAS